eukprot:g1741.t1
MESAPKTDVQIAGFEAQPYDELERDFHEVLQGLVGDRSLEKFRIEYEKIFRVVRKSHDNEKRLLKKCRELNAEIVANAAKVQTALKLSEDDQSTITSLKKEIEKAWNLVDVSREKAMEVQEKLKRTEADRDQLEKEVSDLKNEIGAKKTETEREGRKKDRLEKEMKEIKETLETRQFEIQQKQTQIVQCEETIARLEQMMRDSRSTTDKIQKEYNQLNEKVIKSHHDLEEQIHTNTQLLAENSQKQVELKMKDEEIEQMKIDVSKAIKAKEQSQKKVKTLESEKQEVEREKDVKKSELQTLEKEIAQLRKELEFERKKQDEMMRERDILNKMKMQAERSTEHQMDLIKINQNTTRNLEHEIQGYKLENQRQMKQILLLEKERDKYGTEANEANNKYNEMVEEVKTREIRIMDLQKKITDSESKLKQQQNLYEAIRADRNMYSKNLIGAQDSIQEMKRKLKIMNHQIEQLKEEISAKDLALLKEHFDHMKVQKERETFKSEVTKMKTQINDAEMEFQHQKSELEKLTQIVQEADQERVRQKKEYETVSNERDILGTQLIRRNDELALLYEKLKIQQTALSKGQIQYTNRCNEIRLLKIKLNDLQREQLMLKNSIANIDVLKKEVHHLSHELLHERTKVKALGEELEHPLNVHRWRKLEGSDPTTFELIRKVQTLQKRLIAKTEEVVEKNLSIQEKEKLYCELKQMLARQPGPEVVEQIQAYKMTLKEKTKQLKSMAAEMNMYQAQINEYKYEIGKLLKELNVMKSKYFEMKRKEQVMKQKNNELESQVKFESYIQPKIHGGGFTMTTSATNSSQKNSV